MPLSRYAIRDESSGKYKLVRYDAFRRACPGVKLKFGVLEILMQLVTIDVLGDGGRIDS